MNDFLESASGVPFKETKEKINGIECTVREWSVGNLTSRRYLTTERKSIEDKSYNEQFRGVPETIMAEIDIPTLEQTVALARSYIVFMKDFHPHDIQQAIAENRDFVNEHGQLEPIDQEVRDEYRSYYQDVESWLKANIEDFTATESFVMDNVGQSNNERTRIRIEKLLETGYRITIDDPHDNDRFDPPINSISVNPTIWLKEIGLEDPVGYSKQQISQVFSHPDSILGGGTDDVTKDVPVETFTTDTGKDIKIAITQDPNRVNLN
jgi:hypothetical protein